MIELCIVFVSIVNWFIQPNRTKTGPATQWRPIARNHLSGPFCKYRLCCVRWAILRNFNFPHLSGCRQRAETVTFLQYFTIFIPPQLSVIETESAELSRISSSVSVYCSSSGSSSSRIVSISGLNVSISSHW